MVAIIYLSGLLLLMLARNLYPSSTGLSPAHAAFQLCVYEEYSAVGTCKQC